MYKFEIHRNPNNPLSSSTYDDQIRYYEALYRFERNINPVWSDLSIKHEKDDGRFFFREHLDGDLTLIGSDYEWANKLLNDVGEINMYRLLYLKEYKNGSWEIIWTGFFSIADGEFDLAKCSVTFKELLVFDKYSVVLENIEKKVNLIDSPNIPVFYEIHTYSYETDISTTQEYYGISGNCTTPSAPSLIFVLEAEKYPDELEKWTLYSKKTSYGGQGYNGSTWSWIYNITLEYRRDIAYANANPDVSKWVLIEAGVGGALNKYARHYKDMDSLSFNVVQYSRQYEVLPLSTYCTFRYATNTVILPSDLEVENDRARLFTAAISLIIAEFSTINSYESLFFNGVTNPITGTVNRLNNIVIFQLSDMRPTSDAATLGMFSFKDVENWLRMFQCGWYIDEYSNIKIEHRKYFDLGLSYSGATNGLDISSNQDVLNVKTISYTKDLPQQESMEFAYSNNQDFVGLPIIYHGNIVNRREGSNSSTLSFSNLSTDLTYITSNSDAIGKDGFFMATVEINGLGELRVPQTNGAISSALIWNGFLSVANLQKDYWKWWRSISKGVMNGAITDFTEKNNIIQEDLIVTNCSDFNPYHIVITSYGDGKVESAVLALKDKRLTLKLSYGE